MTSVSGLPEGFAEVAGRGDSAAGAVRFVAVVSRIEELASAGLNSPRRWRELLGSKVEGAGRGATARFQLQDGSRVFLKQMRRGGMAGPLWKERFPGTRRLLGNVEIPLLAASRGIATAAPLALLLAEGPTGLYRAWMAFEEIPNARDLVDRFASGPLPDDAEIGEVMKLIRRMHDAGIDHRDLNLGNLLLSDEQARPRVWIIDLDRAVVHSGPLDFRERQRALRRLERSYAKLVGDPGAIRRDWLGHYAGVDRELLERLL